MDKLLLNYAEIRGVNLKFWVPDNELSIFEIICIDIGIKGKKGSDKFFIKIATPEGIREKIENNYLLIKRPLIIINEYDGEMVLEQLRKMLGECQEPNWLASVKNMQKYFEWEFDDFINNESQ